MQFWCQVAIALNFVLAFFIGVYHSFNGREARKPAGFTGFVVTVIVMALMVFVYVMAGAFSELKWW